MGVLSQYCKNLGLLYCNLITQIFQYLAGTLELGIRFRADVTYELVRYTDSHWAGFKDWRKLMASYTFLLSRGPVSHQSKQQAIVAFFSMEAKYIASTKTRKKALWIAQFLAALKYRLPNQSVSIKVNNKGAILFVTNPAFYQ